MCTIIYQPYLAHSKTGFQKVDNGLLLRWPSGGVGILDAHYEPKEGDYLLRQYYGGDGIQTLKSRYGLELADCAGGAAWRLVAAK